MVKRNGPKLEIVTHADRVASFQRDIIELNLIDVIRKHITTGDPATIDSDTYFELRSRIAARYQLHPNQVVIIGSSRLGFSLEPEIRYAERAPPKMSMLPSFQNHYSISEVDPKSWTVG